MSFWLKAGRYCFFIFYVGVMSGLVYLADRFQIPVPPSAVQTETIEPESVPEIAENEAEILPPSPPVPEKTTFQEPGHVQEDFSEGE